MLSLGRIVIGRKLTTGTLQSIVIARPFTTVEFKPKLGKRDPEQKKEAVVATKKFDELNPGVFKDFTAKITDLFHTSRDPREHITVLVLENGVETYWYTKSARNCSADVHIYRKLDSITPNDMFRISKEMCDNYTTIKEHKDKKNAVDTYWHNETKKEVVEWKIDFIPEVLTGPAYHEWKKITDEQFKAFVKAGAKVVN